MQAQHHCIVAINGADVPSDEGWVWMTSLFFSIITLIHMLKDKQFSRFNAYFLKQVNYIQVLRINSKLN